MRARRLLISFLFILSGCNAVHSVDLDACGVSASRIDAYMKTVFPATERCAQCHASSTAPTFRAPNPTLAFQAAYPTLKGNPTRMAIRSGNGHCGQDACKGENSDILDAIESFKKAAGDGCNSQQRSGIESETGRLVWGPAALSGMNATSFVTKTLTLPDGATADAKLNAVKLTYKIRQHGSTGYCILRDIAVQTPAMHARMQRFYLVLNNRMATEYLNFADVERSVQKTTGTTYIPIVTFSQLFKCADTDAVGLSVVVTERDDPGAPVVETRETAYEVFVRAIAPELRRKNLIPVFGAQHPVANYLACIDCHTASHPKFYMNNTSDQTLFDSIRPKIDTTNPQASILTIRAASLGDFHYFPYRLPKPWADKPEFLNTFYDFAQRLAVP